jgi:hypothetical protein
MGVGSGGREAASGVRQQMQAGSSLRPGRRAITLIVVWLVAVVIVAAASQVRAGDQPSGAAASRVVQPISPHVARADTEESPALTLAIVAVLAAGGLTAATLRRGLGPVKARRLVPVAQRVVRRS